MEDGFHRDGTSRKYERRIRFCEAHCEIPWAYSAIPSAYSVTDQQDRRQGVRTALYEAGHIILTQPLNGCTALKSWAMRLAKRAGMKKAKVARSLRGQRL